MTHQPVDLDAGAEGRDRVAADQVMWRPKGVLAHDEGEDDEAGNRDPGDERHAEKASGCR